MAKKIRHQATSLRSSYLLEIRSRFAEGYTDDLEFNEGISDSVLDEFLEITNYINNGELYLYQTIIVGGDQIASYCVRENVKKRADRIVLRMDRFPLLSGARQIVTSFSWCWDKLRGLSVPPGQTAEDDRILESIRERWTSLSNGNAH